MGSDFENFSNLDFLQEAKSGIAIWGKYISLDYQLFPKDKACAKRITKVFKV